MALSSHWAQLLAHRLLLLFYFFVCLHVELLYSASLSAFLVLDFVLF